MSSRVPTETITIGNLTILIDKPLALVGFLYFTINGNEGGRIVFNRQDFDDQKPFEFHFNQTVLSLDDGDSAIVKKSKFHIRFEICDHFDAIDQTFDLAEYLGETQE